MTHLLVTVAPQDPVGRARRLLVDHAFGALPVVDRDGRLVGIVGAADLLDLPADRSDRTPVGSVMSTQVLTAGPDTEVHVLAARLATYGDHRVMPVVAHARLVGLVTRGDLLRPGRSGGAAGRLARRLWRAARRPRPDGGAGPSGRHVLRVVGEAPSLPSAAQEPPRASLRARDVMNSRDPLVTVTADTPGERAAGLMTGHHLAEVPVVDGRGGVLGVLGEADLLAVRGWRTHRVGALMRSDPEVLGPEAEFAELARMLARDGVRTVPIVADGVLVGAVSRRDLL